MIANLDLLAVTKPVLEIGLGNWRDVYSSMNTEHENDMEDVNLLFLIGLRLYILCCA